MNRRGFLRAGLAALALTTGLARAGVELVDDEAPLYLAPIRWISIDDLRREYDYQRAYIEALTTGGALKVAVVNGRLEAGFVAPARFLGPHCGSELRR